MDFDLIALSPYCDQIWNIKNFFVSSMFVVMHLFDCLLNKTPR